MSKNLLLTLGHNSSAVLVDGDNVICGYEEERLSKVKSDSAFPRLAIMKCLEENFCESLDTIYISYWNDDFTIFDADSKVVDKHFDRKFLNTLCKQYGAHIQYLSEKLTHHDAHAYAALNFFENHATAEDKEKDFHVIVSDGFGNKEEVTTVYHRKSDGSLEVVQKVRDYFISVGLMYQYATSFCGMKENEDEYKFLGYESHIDEVLPQDKIELLYKYSNAFVEAYLKRLEFLKGDKNDNGYINVSKLKAVKEFWSNEFTNMLNIVAKGVEISEWTKRCIVGAFIQDVIEKFVGHFLKAHNIQNVILSGGIFYNVKLNNYVMNHIPGKICVYPLCGDQGCGFGLYRYYHGTFNFKTLLIGKRNLNPTPSIINYISDKNVERFSVYNDKQQFIDKIVELLRKDAIVNVMTGNLEFGPRALCSTTTFAQPSEHNFKYINKLNGRNAVMPFAPVILERNAEKYFGEEQIDRIIGSNNYMIITMNHLKEGERTQSYTGILHKYPLKNVYSSRCQFVPDNSTQYVKEVLEKLEDVNDFWIQTSHNEHGRPILLSVNDALKNHLGTLKNDDENRSYTLIGNF